MAVASPVKILEESRVALPATVALPTEPVMLSALDAQWVTLPLIQRVLIFVDGADGDSMLPFASVAAALRASLPATLARFPTLGGKLVHLPGTGDAAIDCRANGGGVRFVVAQTEDVEHDARRLAEDESHDAEMFARLVPALDAGQLPAEAMAAQVTRLRGGVALGVAMHHAVVDGRSVWRFLQAWAAACRGEGDADLAAAPPPAFDRKAIRLLPGGGDDELARSVLRKYAPDLPVAAVAGFLIRPNLSRRTFSITPEQMHNLKQRITVSNLSPAPSSFVAVVALAWASFVHAKHPDATAPSDDFGTCISGCLAAATARDLLASDGVALAAAAVAAEVRRAAEEPAAGWEWMDTVSRRADMNRLVNVAGSSRFPACEATDFGWGRPPGKGDDGGVQASVSLHPAHMDAYKAHFLSYLLG